MANRPLAPNRASARPKMSCGCRAHTDVQGMLHASARPPERGRSRFLAWRRPGRWGRPYPRSYHRAPPRQARELLPNGNYTFFKGVYEDKGKVLTDKLEGLFFTSVGADLHPLFFKENQRSFLLFRCWQNSGVSGSLLTISSYFSPGMFLEADFRYTTFLGAPGIWGL